MLEEQKREEKSGYQFTNQQPTQAQKRDANSGKYSRDNSRKEDDIIDTYGDDFEEEIEEDLPEDNHLLDSNDHHKNITESAGITVSQSLGVDPSVDSLALEDYDHIEPVERLS